MTKKIDKKAKILIGLKKARTSLNKVIQTLENEDKNTDKQCFDVIQQNLAVVGLLKSANIAMLKNHLDFYIDSIDKKNVSKKELEKMKVEIVRIVQTAQRK
jgi:DNA-binding FrmR family transcriptional regulator